MKTITALIAAGLIAGGSSVALAQGSGAGASGGGSAAGADPSTPRQNMVRPTPNSPIINRRGDDMAPMQGADVSNRSVQGSDVSNRSGGQLFDSRTFR